MKLAAKKKWLRIAAVVLLLLVLMVLGNKQMNWKLLSFKDPYEKIEFFQTEKASFPTEIGTFKLRFTAYNHEMHRLDICVQCPWGVDVFHEVDPRITLDGAVMEYTISPNSGWPLSHTTYFLKNVSSGQKVTFTMGDKTIELTVP